MDLIERDKAREKNTLQKMTASEYLEYSQILVFSRYLVFPIIRVQLTK